MRTQKFIATKLIATKSTIYGHRLSKHGGARKVMLKISVLLPLTHVKPRCAGVLCIFTRNIKAAVLPQPTHTDEEDAGVRVPSKEQWYV